MKRIGRILALVVAWFGVIVFFTWALGAIWHISMLPYPTGPFLAVCILIAFAVLFFQLGNKHLWLTYAAGTVTLVWVLLQFKQPSHDRDWAKDQQVLSHIEVRQDKATIHNFRHNDYRSDSDFDVHRSDFQFKLSELEKVWFIVQRFTPGEGLAHVFLTFQVTPEEGEPKYFSLSVEIRREEGEYFSPVQGLYRHYELNYVFGDERDLIGVRTVMRPEDRIYMYPVNATPYEVQKLFRSITSRTNQIFDRPEFYHTLLNNCMNGILRHTSRMTPEEISWFDPNIVLPGYSDRFAYRLGIIGDADQSFDELKEACRIDGRARTHGIRDGFSKAIRNIGGEQSMQ
jgi:hypothetical protein